jgi:hypothetical protein
MTGIIFFTPPQEIRIKKIEECSGDLSFGSVLWVAAKEKSKQANNPMTRPQRPERKKGTAFAVPGQITVIDY